LIEGRFAMDSQGSSRSTQALTLAFLGGVIAGAVTGILLAPRSGEDTRRRLSRHARKAEEEVIEKAKEARVALDEMIERGQHFLAEKRADVEAAMKAGKDAVKAHMDKCCS
jgi:gas vesicle protein